MELDRLIISITAFVIAYILYYLGNGQPANTPPRVVLWVLALIVFLVGLYVLVTGNTLIAVS